MGSDPIRRKMGRKPRFHPKSLSAPRLPPRKTRQSDLAAARALSQHASTPTAGNGCG
jgi:hypothetical protein